MTGVSLKRMCNVSVAVAERNYFIHFRDYYSGLQEAYAGPAKRNLLMV
jgi:hypothetical protein